MPVTRPSTASLFTGQFPDTHGIVYNLTESIEPDFTLASAFSRAGHRTALFSSNPQASPHAHVGTHFEESYYRPLDLIELGFSPSDILTQLEDWLDANAKSRFLIYLHFLPPHWPYEQPVEFTQFFEDRTPPGRSPDAYSPLKFSFPIGDQRVHHEHPPLPEWLNLYDANLRYADWAVGEVLRMLGGAGILGQTLVIVTSDHGEAFGEHGYVWHEDAIHDEVSRIPLIVRFPSKELSGESIDCLTQTIDVLPTLCDLFGIPFPAPDIQGHSLLPVLAGATDSVADHAVVQSYHPDKYMVREQRYALLIYREPKWHALYDLRSDPEQRINIRPWRQREFERLLRVFSDYAREQRHSPEPFVNWWPRPARRSDVKAIPPEMKKALEALGYLK
jgi:arylsulfatase A-like enzyme